MSRIDEALKRASQGPLANRAPRAAAEAPLRLADEFTVSEHALDGRAVVVSPVERPDVPLNAASRPATRAADVRPPSGIPALPPDEKLVVGAGRNAVSTEQYRRLAATLHEAQTEKGLKTVMVTSAVPKEGKTLTAVNLALTLSESYGRRVLIIDADLRRPSLHEVLGIRNDIGLSDVLRSNRIEANLVQISPRLSVLPSGRPDQNPLEGLSSARMRALLEEAAAKFDWVIIDTPPIGLLPDAQLLGRLAQAAIFVIRAGVTPFEAVNRAIAELGRDCIIGTVLNGVDYRSMPPTAYGDYYGRE